MARCYEEQKTLTLGELTLHYTWARKAVKNYNLRVRRDGSVYLSTPLRVTPFQAERFLVSKLDFVLRARARLAEKKQDAPLTLCEGEQVPIFGVLHTVCHLKAAKPRVFLENGTLTLALPHPEDAAARIHAFWAFARTEVQTLMTELTAAYAPLFLSAKASTPCITLRRMKGRWGTCFYTKNKINYNTQLIFLPKGCAHYVACHELAHFCHHDHSAQFYACLARALPAHKEWRRVLREFPLPLLGQE